MKVKVKPTEKIEVLKQNMEKRAEKIEVKDGKLVVELDEPSKLGKIPGVDSYKIGDERNEGLKGKPVDKPAYAKIESMKDAVKALIATIEGYDLRILNSDREWDIRRLRTYNPDIKHLKSDSPLEVLDIDKTISELEGIQNIDVDIPEKKEKIKQIYQEMLT